MMELIINLSGVVLIGLVIWWFWFSVPEAKKAQANARIDVLVENGVYEPARIEVPVGKNITLVFQRNDASPCAEKVIFNELDKAYELNLGQQTEIEVSFEQPGEYSFNCDMNMYRGTVLAK